MIRFTLAKPRRLRRDSRRAGFSIIEMLVVLSIIGAIVALVGPRVLGYLDGSKIKTTRIQMENIASALDLFYLDTGRYPTTEEGLSVLLLPAPPISNWNGPYLKTSKLVADAWGHKYVYEAPGKKDPYDIASPGPKGKDGVLTKDAIALH